MLIWLTGYKYQEIKTLLYGIIGKPELCAIHHEAYNSDPFLIQIYLLNFKRK